MDPNKPNNTPKTSVSKPSQLMLALSSKDSIAPHTKSAKDSHVSGGSLNTIGQANGDAYPPVSLLDRDTRQEDLEQAGLGVNSVDSTSNGDSENNTSVNDVPEFCNWASYDSSFDLDPRAIPVASANARRFPPQRPGDRPFRSEEERRSIVEKVMAIAPRFHPHTGQPVVEKVPEEPQKGQHISSITLPENPATVFHVSLDEVDDAWRSLSGIRSDVKNIGNMLQMARIEMKRARDEAATADNVFMGQASTLLLMADLPEKMGQQVMILRTCREKLHQTEIEYERLEGQLRDSNNLMESKELEFWSLLTTGVREADQREKSQPAIAESSQKHPEEKESRDTVVPDVLRGISPHGPEDQMHPLLRDLLKASAEWRNYQEEYHDLIISKGLHEDELLSLNIKKGDDIPEWFKRARRELVVLESSMKHSLDESEAKALKLEATCRDRNIQSPRYEVKRGKVIDNFHVDGIEALGIGDISPDPDAELHGSYPELLTQGYNLLSGDEPLTPYASVKAAVSPSNVAKDKQVNIRKAVKEYEIQRLLTTPPDDDSSSSWTFGFIQRWILQQVRMSQLQAALLRGVFVTTQNLEIYNIAQWQLDVLYFWYKDGLNATSDRALQGWNDPSLCYSDPLTRRPSISASVSNMRREFGKGRHGLTRKPDSIWTTTGADMSDIYQAIEFKPRPSTILKGHLDYF